MNKKQLATLVIWLYRAIPIALVTWLCAEAFHGDPSAKDLLGFISILVGLIVVVVCGFALYFWAEENRK